MNKYIISIVLVYSATSLSVNAALTGNDLAAANAYFKAHPEIIVYAPWIRDNVMNANNLESANNTLIKNTYYNGSGVIDVQQIPAWIPPVTTSPPLYNVAEQSSKTEVSYRPATSQPNHSEINASAMKLAQAQQEQKLVNTAVITNNNVNASAMKLAQTQQEQKLVNTAVITNNNVNASAMKLAQAQQEQKLVNTAVITNNNVNASAMKLAQTQQEQKLVNTAVITNNNANASAMKLAQAQQEQKLVNTAVITNNNVNASAMKLAQAQQEQKLVNTAVITNNNVNASAMKLTQAQQEQKMIGEHTAPAGMDLSSTVSSSKPIVQQVSSQPIKATAKDPSVSASEPGAISQEHFNTLDHAHNENVNAIASNHSAINANSTAISRNANRIEHLESQQDTDRKHADAGAANALAISGLHYTNDVNSIAIGAGNYESENAASIGYRHTFNEGHAAVTVAASEDSVGNNGLAVSGAIGW